MKEKIVQDVFNMGYIEKFPKMIGIGIFWSPYGVRS